MFHTRYMLLSGIQRGQMFILIKNCLNLLGLPKLTMSLSFGTHYYYSLSSLWLFFPQHLTFDSAKFGGISNLTIKREAAQSTNYCVKCITEIVQTHMRTLI